MIHFPKWSFPGGTNGKEPACQCRRSKKLRLNLWVGKIPLEEKMATHSSILACGESHGQRSLLEVHRIPKSWTVLEQLSMHVPPNNHHL